MRNKNKIWTSFGLAVSISILLKVLLPVPENEILNYDRFWTLKTHGTEKYNIIFGGDSRVYRGISPHAVEEVLSGMNVLNLGYSSGGFSAEMFELMTSRLKKNEKRIVVLGVTPFSLTSEALKNEQLNKILLETESEKFKNLNINPLLLLFNPYEMDYIFFGWASYRGDHYFQEYLDNGWVKSDRVPHSTDKALASYKDVFENNTVQHQSMVQFIEQINLMESNGIEVFAFTPPSSSKMEALEDSLSQFDRQIFINTFKEAGGNWIDLDEFEFTSYDGSHLHYESATQLSKIIANHIKTHSIIES